VTRLLGRSVADQAPPHNAAAKTPDIAVVVGAGLACDHRCAHAIGAGRDPDSDKHRNGLLSRPRSRAFLCVRVRSSARRGSVRCSNAERCGHRTALLFEAGTSSANVWRPNHLTNANANAHKRTLQEAPTNTEPAATGHCAREPGTQVPNNPRMRRLSPNPRGYTCPASTTLLDASQDGRRGPDSGSEGRRRPQHRGFSSSSSPVAVATVPGSEAQYWL